jgi:hypothetical protein
MTIETKALLDDNREGCRKVDRMSRIVSITVLVALFVCLLSITAPFYQGDARGYVLQIHAVRHESLLGGAASLWEFGHLIWRPLGWVFAQAVSEGAGSEGEAIARTWRALIWINRVCGVLAGVAWYVVAYRFTRRHLRALLIAVTFFCSNAVLNYTQTGSSYVAGLCALSVGMAVFLLQADSEDGCSCWMAWIGGALVGSATLLWFPYVLAIPATLMVEPYWRSLQHNPRTSIDLKLMVHGAAAIALCIAIGYAVAIAAHGFNSTGAVYAWMNDSAHGWSQNRNLLRLPTGLARSYVNLGADGLLFKRFVNADPYAPVTVLDLVRASIWKLALFYAFCAAIAYAYVRRRGSQMYWLFPVVSGLPILGFAVFVFEPGSPERYLPFLPFLVLISAVVLAPTSTGRSSVYANAIVVTFLIVASFVNINAMSRANYEAHQRLMLQRLRALQSTAADRSLIALLSNQDDLYQFQNGYVDQYADSRTTLQWWDVIEPGNRRLPEWRRGFGVRVIATWDGGTECWASKRLWATRPVPDWKWAEGDDPRIKWTDIYSFFRQLETDGSVGGDDGFNRLARTEHNRRVLSGHIGPSIAQSGSSQHVP